MAGDEHGACPGALPPCLPASLQLLVPQEEVTSESEEEGGEEEEETISPDSGKTPPAACWSSQPSSTDLLACHALHRSPPVIEQCSPAAAQLTRCAWRRLLCVCVQMWC